MIERFASVNGVRLHYVEAGAGRAVVLVHGFPDFWYTWRRQIPALEAAGMRVLALDLRGYNRSDRPPRIADYDLEKLLGDIVGFSESVAGHDCALVGHDWGGVLAWYAAARRPDLFRRLVVLNAPHPARYLELLRGTTQLLRSWYVAAFQVPWLPERLLAARMTARLRRGARSGRTDEELQRYAEVFANPAAWRGPVNFYRAAVRGFIRRHRRADIHVKVPTLVLWGDLDPYLDVRNTAGLGRWVSQLRVVRLSNAGHWLHVDEADGVNRELVAFLR
jgi:pimeloyl-ACP methyl ester carboxylesterase